MLNSGGGESAILPVNTIPFSSVSSQSQSGSSQRVVVRILSARKTSFYSNITDCIYYSTTSKILPTCKVRVPNNKVCSQGTTPPFSSARSIEDPSLRAKFDVSEDIPRRRDLIQILYIDGADGYSSILLDFGRFVETVADVGGTCKSRSGIRREWNTF